MTRKQFISLLCLPFIVRSSKQTPDIMSHGRYHLDPAKGFTNAGWFIPLGRDINGNLRRLYIPVGNIEVGIEK